mmetsp:Transcript_51813/g.110147  ORF Transcript_51813/g.110147 Transcript_51813/m.110147 type:complete len:237 (+) Transcript_51813:762-1472(+)
MMQGLLLRARSKTTRTDRSLSPTYLSRSSGPLTEMKLAPDSLAMAFARRVFPQPGGPYSSTPAGSGSPSASNRSGWPIGSSTLSVSSSRMPDSAPTSSQDTSGTVANPSRFDDGWTFGKAERKSSMVMRRGSSCSGVSGVIDWMSLLLHVVSSCSFVARDVALSASPFVTLLSSPAPGDVPPSSTTSSPPAIQPPPLSPINNSLWKMRLIAITAASFVKLRISAPTNPGVLFANIR